MNDKVFRQQEVFSEYIEEETRQYVKAKGFEVEYVGFWMRLYSKHFRPCKHCQRKLIELLNNSALRFDSQKMSVGFHQCVDEKKNEIYYEFAFPFVDSTFLYTWKPCVKDQQELRKIILECKHFRIGNKDYTDPVELYREFDIDDKSWIELERRTPTAEEKKKYEEGEL